MFKPRDIYNSTNVFFLLTNGWFGIKYKQTNYDVFDKSEKASLSSNSVNGVKNACQGVNKQVHKTHSVQVDNWYTHNRFAPLLIPPLWTV